MTEYKVGYVDLSYQNREILTVMRKSHYGAVMLRAAAECDGHRGCTHHLRLAHLSTEQFDDFDLLADADRSEGVLPQDGQLQNDEIHDDMMSAVTREYFPYPVIVKRSLLGVEIPSSAPPITHQFVLTDLTERQRETIDAWFTAAFNHADKWGIQV